MQENRAGNIIKEILRKEESPLFDRMREKMGIGSDKDLFIFHFIEHVKRGKKLHPCENYSLVQWISDWVEEVDEVKAVWKNFYEGHLESVKRLRDELLDSAVVSYRMAMVLDEILKEKENKVE